MRLTRKDFIRLGLGAAAAGLAPGFPRELWGKPAPRRPDGFPDLVAVKDGSPAQMFETGIRALGGMDRFVKKGQTVLVKPNIGWNKTPSDGANTNPDLVAKIIEAAYKAGAKKVYCFDHSVNLEKDCYRRSGIEDAVKTCGGKMRSARKKSHYRKAEIPGASVLQEVLVHKLYMDCDTVINVPVLKNHGGGRITACLKNLMGVVWDRRFWHRKGLHQCIGEFALLRKPDLNVVDAYLVMMKNGPRGVSTEDLALKRMQLLSTDPVLADTAGARILGVSEGEVSHLAVARKLGLGTMDLKGSSIKRISLKA